MKLINEYGIKFNITNKEEIAQNVLKKLSNGERRIHLTGVDLNVLTLSLNDMHLADSINESDIVNIDGNGVVLLLNKKGHRDIKRCTCCDVFEELLQVANKNHHSIYLIGAEQHVLEKMVENIKSTFSNIKIVGFHNGFYDNENEIIKDINQKSPDYLFLGLPSPMKEIFIAKNKKNLNVGVFYGIGGAFNIWGEKLKRAPIWIQNLGFEWLYRLINNPAIAKRLINAFTVIILKRKI